MNRNNRILKVRNYLNTVGYRGMLITSPANIFYLSGFTGSSGALIITNTDNILISDFRYQTQAKIESPGWNFFEISSGLLKGINDILFKITPGIIAFESDFISYSGYDIISANGMHKFLIPVKNIIENMRVVKDNFEVELIRQAAKITDLGCKKVFNMIQPGISEKELAIEAEFEMKKSGAEGMAFDIIIGGGENGAKPHSTPGDYKLKHGDLVVIDMGAKYGGYCADMTRTICIGSADNLSNEIYNICYKAQTTALNALKSGQKGSFIDNIAREIISTAGYGEMFGHGLGHSVGIDIHENPRLSKLCDDEIPAGTVITVEPGIYIPAKGGVRIEDLVLVTDNGCEIITGMEKSETLFCI